MLVISREEADKKCIKLFGLNAEDYAKKIMEEWKKEQESVKNSDRL